MSQNLRGRDPQTYKNTWGGGKGGEGPGWSTWGQSALGLGPWGAEVWGAWGHVWVDA